jgi:hypothetical protein
MRTTLIVMLVVFFVAILSVALMAGAGEPDPRTFVFVREVWQGQIGMVVGADVRLRRLSDKEEWIFPRTGPGGWTNRQVPDGQYLVTVTKDGYIPKIVSVKIPTGERFPHRDYTVLMERVR